MGRTIRCFMSMASPWAYLGHDACLAIARRHGVGMRFVPTPLRRLFPETGGLPLPRRHPVRQRYRLVELQRWRARRCVPLNLAPRVAPMEAEPLDRLVIAIDAAGHDPDPFMRRVFAAYWAEDSDLGDRTLVAALLAETGLPAVLLERAAGQETASVYEANLAAALAEGIFGAPSYVLDGEIFWGQDRLDLLDEALASGRAPYRPE